MNIIVNGSQKDYPQELTVRELLQSLSVDERMVAVECNLEIVPKEEFSTFKICNGMEIEILRFVGGG